MTPRLSAALRVIAGTLLLLSSLGSVARAAPAEDEVPALAPSTFRLNDPARGVSLRARVELGSLGVLSHRIQYGRGGTRVNYRSDADQDTLFFFARLSAELEMKRRHTLVFVYQPLQFETESRLGRDLRLGAVVLPRDSITRFGYGFDFYRIAYQFDIFRDARRELAFGAGFQIRNARVTFVRADGADGFTQSNLGVVPLLRIRARYVFDNALFLESELDGWVSPVPGNGEDALGAIADGSLRAGVMVRPWSEVFLNLRYLGGGFRGESSERTPGDGGDGYSSNWLHTMIFSLGLGVR